MLATTMVFNGIKKGLNTYALSNAHSPSSSLSLLSLVHHSPQPQPTTLGCSIAFKKAFREPSFFNCSYPPFYFISFHSAHIELNQKKQQFY